MSTSHDAHGRIVFDDAVTAEAWVGDDADRRAVGCPDCHRVHWDGGALVCCDTGRALPLIGNGHRWRLALSGPLLEHLYPKPAGRKA